MPRGLHFNLAHTTGMVAMAVGRVARIGVDVEGSTNACRCRWRDDIFPRRSRGSSHALPPEAATSGDSYRLWTLKEAYLKAVGTGLAGGLGSMTFTSTTPVASPSSAPTDPQAPRWQFREFTPPGFRLALACFDPATRGLPSNCTSTARRTHMPAT